MICAKALAALLFSNNVDQVQCGPGCGGCCGPKPTEDNNGHCHSGQGMKKENKNEEENFDLSSLMGGEGGEDFQDMFAKLMENGDMNPEELEKLMSSMSPDATNTKDADSTTDVGEQSASAPSEEEDLPPMSQEEFDEFATGLGLSEEDMKQMEEYIGLMPKIFKEDNLSDKEIAQKFVRYYVQSEKEENADSEFSREKLLKAMEDLVMVQIPEMMQGAQLDSEGANVDVTAPEVDMSDEALDKMDEDSEEENKETAELDALDIEDPVDMSDAALDAMDDVEPVTPAPTAFEGEAEL